MLSRWKKGSPLDFSFFFLPFQVLEDMFMCTYASSGVKESAFLEKMNSRSFCWFPAAILVDQNGAPIWRLHTKLFKGAWNVSANNSKTVGHKDLRLGQILYILSFITFHFLGFFQWTVSYLFFGCVTVKIIYEKNSYFISMALHLAPLGSKDWGQLRKGISLGLLTLTFKSLWVFQRLNRPSR